MTKRIWICSALLSLAIMSVTVACGGGRGSDHHPGDGGGELFSSARLSQTTIHGMHVHAARTTTTSRLVWDSLMPTVEAASTVSVDQNWEGICSGSPTVADTASFAVYGIGQSNSPSCTQFYVPGDATGQGAATNAQAGKVVFGAGTFSNLVASTDKGTVIVSPSGVPVHLWINRAGTITDTGISCAIPAGSDELICRTTGLFLTSDLDRVVATATIGAGDKLVGLTVGFTKVLP